MTLHFKGPASLWSCPARGCSGLTGGCSCPSASSITCRVSGSGTHTTGCETEFGGLPHVGLGLHEHTHNRLARQSFVDSPVYSWFTWAHRHATAWLALCIVALISLSKDPSLDGTFPQFLKYLLVGRHINNYFVVRRHITNTLVLFTTETWQTNYVNARKKCYKQTMFMHTRHNKHTRF